MIYGASWYSSGWRYGLWQIHPHRQLHQWSSRSDSPCCRLVAAATMVSRLWFDQSQNNRTISWIDKAHQGYIWAQWFEAENTKKDQSNLVCIRYWEQKVIPECLFTAYAFHRELDRQKGTEHPGRNPRIPELRGWSLLSRKSIEPSFAVVRLGWPNVIRVLFAIWVPCAAPQQKAQRCSCSEGIPSDHKTL